MRHGKQWKYSKEALEGGAKGCDVEPVKTGPDEEFELLISSVFEYFSILGK